MLKANLWRQAKAKGCAPSCGYRAATLVEIEQAIANADKPTRIQIELGDLEQASKAKAQDARIEIRLPESEKRDMERCAAKLGHGLSGYIRALHRIAAAKLA